MTLPDLSDLAAPGTRFDVRVTPKASRAGIRREGDVLRVSVTEVPEKARRRRP